MATLIKASPLIVASALMLTGCTSSSSALYIDPLDATGKPYPGFARGNMPTLYYNPAGYQPSGAVLKVRRKPDGINVRSEYIPATFYNEGTTALDLNEPHSWPPSQKIQLPGLKAGNYTAELWIQGRMKTSLSFSVSGKPQLADGFLTAYDLHLVPLPETRHAAIRHIASQKSSMARILTDQAIDRLDAFVGLTDQQRAEAKQIYFDEFSTREAASLSETELPGQAAIRQETKARIRAQLTPEQQKLYDDDGPHGWAANPKVERLDELVGLTPGQKVTADKIFNDETFALEKFTTIRERAELGVDIRKNVRAKIRALLTPDQQKVYDETSLRFGGGATQATANIDTTHDL